MIPLILQSALIWTVLYAFYHLYLSKSTYFNINRFYLLTALALGIIIPQAKLFFESKYSVYQINVALFQIESNTSSIPVNNVEQLWTLENFARLIYAIGFFIVFSRFLYGLYKIYTLYKEGEKTKLTSFVKVENSKKHLPFSFFNMVFISKDTTYTNSLDHIMNHEKVHINQWHSLDILISELFHCFFWFNPLLLLYKKSIKENHEFIADSFVTKGCSIQSYKTLLASETMSGLEMALTNQFFQSQIKNRINMLHTNQSSKYVLLRYAVAVPIVVAFIAVFSAYRMPEKFFTPNESSFVITDTIPPAPPAPPEAPAPPSMKRPSAPPAPPKAPAKLDNETEKLFKVVEEMPRFPGCDDKGFSGEELSKCSNTLLFEHISKYIKYPEIAKSNGKEGTAVIQFVVSKLGDIEDVKLLRDPGFDMGKAAVAAGVSLGMEKWIPGKQSGKAVNVLFTLPLKFKLTDEEKSISTELSSLPNDYKYLVNGKQVSKEDVSKLNPESIATIDVKKEVKEIKIELNPGLKTESQITLFQNEPNPFKIGQKTTIRYQLLKEADVTFSFFDISGKVVYTTSFAGQKGDQTFSIDANDLGNEGVYYYQMSALGEKKINKLVLVGK